MKHPVKALTNYITRTKLLPRISSLQKINCHLLSNRRGCVSRSVCVNRLRESSLIDFFTFVLYFAV